MSGRRNSNGKHTNSDNDSPDEGSSRPKKKSRIAQACKSCGTKKQKVRIQLEKVAEVESKPD